MLAENDNVPEELKQRIMQEKNIVILRKWLRLAAKAESVEEFTRRMDEKV